MKFDESEADPGDIIDQRGQGGSGGLGGSGGFGGSGGMGGLGGAAIGSVLGSMLGGRKGKAGGGLGMILVVFVAFLLLKSCLSGGFDLATAGNLNQIPDVATANGAQAQPTAPQTGDPQADDVTFANVVVTNANDLWAREFERGGQRYDRTKLVLYGNNVNTGCGAASSSAGPFYCPADSRVYLDLAFWTELSSRFGASGDFARAYVIAHEVGHHVQNELGISDEVQRIERDDPSQANGATGLSVRLELQADCLAGVWAHARFEQGKLDDGDVKEAITAAGAVGDDTIQRSSVGRVRPDTFTHGSSAQRVAWFQKGYSSGSSDVCDTFSVDDLG